MNEVNVKSAALAAALSLFVGGSAFAAERVAECKTLSDFKKEVHDVSEAAKAMAKAQGQPAPEMFLPDTFNDKAFSPAQYHVLIGMYLQDPRTPKGLPPATGVMLATQKHDKHHTTVALWTRDGKVCGAPMVLPPELMKTIGMVKGPSSEKNGDVGGGSEEGDTHL